MSSSGCKRAGGTHIVNRLETKTRDTEISLRGVTASSPADLLLTRLNPNLIPLSREREKGKLSVPADHNSFLDHQDTAFVEESLNRPDWLADPPGSWDKWND